MQSGFGDGSAVPRKSKADTPPHSRVAALELLRVHVRNLDLVLDCLDRTLLKFRTAWKNLEAVYNDAVTLRAVFRRTIDMLEPHGGVDDQPGFRLELAPAVASIPLDVVLKLGLFRQELTWLLDDKFTVIMLRRTDQDSDTAWNRTFLHSLSRAWTQERARLEMSMTSIKFTEFVSAESLYDALPSTGAASSTLPHRKKKRKKKASLKDCSAEFDVALVQKDFQTIARLLADGADPDAPLKDGHALLFHAVQPCTHPSDGGSSCLVRLLARYGADPDVRDERSIAPLHFASQLGTTAAGLALLEMGADIHVRQFQGVQPLALAAAWKRTTLVLHLLAKRADPNDVDELGITALGTTILTRLPPVSTDIVRALMAYGARATAPGAAVSPIHEVILRRDERELARLLRTCPHLVDHPCRVGMLDSIPNITPLYLAIHTAHEPSVRVLLRAGADVNRATRFGERRDTYAVLAVESQAPLTTLTALLRAGADPNHANDTGRTPLHVAAEATSRVVPAHFTAAGAVRLLLQHGADVRATTHTNANVPLHMAVRAGRADVASVLLDDGGADIDAPLRSGATPFMLAAFRGNLHMLRFLHKRGARTDSVLAIGETAMHGAARRGSIACADFLRRLGLSVDASPGGTGFAPLHAAACRGQDAMVRWLVDKRADPAARMDTAWISQCLGKTVKEEDVGTGSVAEVARAFNHTKVAEYVDEVIAARRRDAEKDAEGDAEAATGDEAPPAQGGGPAQGEGPALGELPGPVGPPASVTDDS